MPTSQLGLARARLKTIAETLTGLAGNCALLRNVDAADLESFQRLTPGTTTFLAVCESSASFGGIDAPVAIHAYLYLRLATQTGTEVDDLVSALKSAWENPANYPQTEHACAGVTFDPYRDVIPEPGQAAVRVHFVCYFPTA